MSTNNPGPSNVSTAFSLLTSHFSSTKIKTKDFLQASTEAVSLIEKFGKVFSHVIYDMTNNIEKLNQKYEDDVVANEYLEEMILRNHTQGEGEGVTSALFFLRRALHFLSIFYEYVIEDTTNKLPSNDLAPFLKRAYSATLEQHRGGWLGTQLFNVLSRFTPTRRQLLSTLALEKDDQEENVIKDMQKYNQELRSCVERIITFFELNIEYE